MSAEKESALLEVAMTYLIDRTLWLVIMGLVLALGVAALLVGYISLYQLAAMQWRDAGLMLGVAAVCVGATLTLCRHWEDLV